MTGRVIDVSSNNHPDNAPINWLGVAQSGVTTAIVKATQGTGYVNPWYATDTAQAELAGIDTLAYHFAGWGDPEVEAGFFMSIAGPKARVLDVETSTDVPWMRSFLAALNLTFSSEMTYGSEENMSQIRAQIPGLTWVAAYGQNYPGYGVLWQFTDAASVGGIIGPVDENRWYGTQTQYDELFAITEPDPPVKESDMIAATPSGNGYWVVQQNGAVFSYGDAVYLGGPNTAPLPAGAVVDGIVSHPTQPGYWISTSLGNVYAYGAARYFGGPGAP